MLMCCNRLTCISPPLLPFVLSSLCRATGEMRESGQEIEQCERRTCDETDDAVQEREPERDCIEDRANEIAPGERAHDARIDVRREQAIVRGGVAPEGVVDDATHQEH